MSEINTSAASKLPANGATGASVVEGYQALDTKATLAEKEVQAKATAAHEKKILFLIAQIDVMLNAAAAERDKAYAAAYAERAESQGAFDAANAAYDAARAKSEQAYVDELQLKRDAAKADKAAKQTAAVNAQNALDEATLTLKACTDKKKQADLELTTATAALVGFDKSVPDAQALVDKCQAKDIAATADQKRAWEEAKVKLEKAKSLCDFKKADADVDYATLEAEYRRQQADHRKPVSTAAPPVGLASSPGSAAAARAPAATASSATDD